MPRNRVLLIEDSGDDAVLITAMLDRVGFEVHHETSLGNAFLVAKRNDFAVVVLDLGLQQSNGLETFRLASHELQDVPIVVLTGDANETLAIAAVSEGAEDYLYKGQLDRELLRRSLRFAIERHARVAAQSANKAKSRFLTQVSHELRTPLTAILGFAEMLENEPETDSVREKAITIRRNGQFLLALVNDLLDLSQVEAGAMKVGREVVDTRSLVADVESLMSVKSSAEVSLKVELASDVPRRFMGDKRRVRQILLNLVGNGLKFTKAGEVGVRVSVDTNRSVIEFCVRDTGVGMRSEEIDSLFEPFTQVDGDAVRRAAGTGLGLSICKDLAELMAGRIEVRSEPDVGSTFTLSLPVSAEELSQPIGGTNALAADGPTGTDTDLPRLAIRVLLADDRRDISQVGKYFLEKCEAEVVIAENGQEAVDATVGSIDDGKPFAVILMDMQMPIMSGREAVKKLRSQSISTPIIALTADAMKGERERLIAIGCDEYFPKPIDGPRLMWAIHDLLLETDGDQP